MICINPDCNTVYPEDNGIFVCPKCGAPCVENENSVSKRNMDNGQFNVVYHLDNHDSIRAVSRDLWTKT